MSENKCFCHLNGYEVKDAKARQLSEEAVNAINAFKEKYKNIDTDASSGDLVDDMSNVLTLLSNLMDGTETLPGSGGGGAKLYKHIVSISMDYEQEDGEDIYYQMVHFSNVVIYSRSSTPFTELDDIFAEIGGTLNAIGIADWYMDSIVVANLQDNGDGSYNVRMIRDYDEIYIDTDWNKSVYDTVSEV